MIRLFSGWSSAITVATKITKRSERCQSSFDWTCPQEVWSKPKWLKTPVWEYHEHARLYLWKDNDVCSWSSFWDVCHFTNTRELRLHISCVVYSRRCKLWSSIFQNHSDLKQKRLISSSQSLVSYFVLLWEFFFQLGQKQEDKSNFS